MAQFVPKIPYPYDLSQAEEWISGLSDKYKTGSVVVFAVVLKSSDDLIGSVRLELQREHDSAELGYWIGTPFNGQGYCTEAAGRLLCYGFRDLNLNCIFAGHFTSNPASGRVIQKLGMKYEGCLRARFKKFGKYLDDAMYSLLKSEFL